MFRFILEFFKFMRMIFLEFVSFVRETFRVSFNIYCST